MYVALVQERQTTEYDPVYEDDPNPTAWLEEMPLFNFCLLCAVGLWYLIVDRVRGE